mmetsp:Transcript_18867/g.55789  ORF Transcript_18867/g.55789 Transcript_18867/m.55789 type:complete len:202 (+) Transcript_18867:365-970(+)
MVRPKDAERPLALGRHRHAEAVTQPHVAVAKEPPRPVRHHRHVGGGEVSIHVVGATRSRDVVSSFPERPPHRQHLGTGIVRRREPIAGAHSRGVGEGAVDVQPVQRRDGHHTAGGYDLKVLPRNDGLGMQPADHRLVPGGGEHGRADPHILDADCAASGELEQGARRVAAAHLRDGVRLPARHTWAEPDQRARRGADRREL